jgi:hypothetical protein
MKNKHFQRCNKKELSGLLTYLSWYAFLRRTPVPEKPTTPYPPAPYDEYKQK